MGRIIALDYGKKRTGIAVTDPLQIIATGLNTPADSTALSCVNLILIFGDENPNP